LAELQYLSHCSLKSLNMITQQGTKMDVVSLLS
jgi:hypothetical protein